MMKTATRGGGIIIEDIKVGDIIYETDYGMWIKTEVISVPVLKDGKYTWQAQSSGGVINYLCTAGMMHYSSKLYREDQVTEQIKQIAK